jgi:hypothetical protein
MPLDLVEMGMSKDLTGEVDSVEPCPRIKAGRGRVVLTTVNHLNSYVRVLTVEDAEGRRETIRPTGFHKFYRAPDENWVSAEQLGEGDQLQGQKGLLHVVANTRIAGVHRVYNMTVEGEHVYRVSSLGALVHNICEPVWDPRVQRWRDPTTGQFTKPPQGGRFKTGIDATEQYQGIQRRQQQLRKQGQGEAIREIEKSRRREQNALDRIRSPKDLEDY